MKVAEMNVATGEIVERDYTPAELAAIAAYVPPAPTTVSRVRALIALSRAGLRGGVEAHIAGAGDVELQIWWANAQEFRRDDPRLNAVATALGLTAAQIDALFDVAAGVT